MEQQLIDLDMLYTYAAFRHLTECNSYETRLQDIIDEGFIIDAIFHKPNQQFSSSRTIVIVHSNDKLTNNNKNALDNN